MTQGTVADLPLHFPECFAADFPRELPIAERAVAAVLAAIQGAVSFQPLEERSPGLRGNDWSNYLRCSEARMVHVAHLLHRKGVTGGRVLDYGAYFGNFSLMFREMGFAVDALDAYGTYTPSLDTIVEMLSQKGIAPLDFADTGRDLAGVAAGTYDVVLCMGVIEHIPHTPRLLLEALDRVMKPGGILVMDTPNAAQLANRQKLARGESFMTPIAIQYHATIPFEGHHREYTVSELVWMVQAAGHQVVAAELFNYSAYGQDRLRGRDVTNFWRMIANPTMRELVLIASRKRHTSEPPAIVTDWQEVFEEVERYWIDRLPPEVASEDGAAIVGNELMLVDLQDGVATRDRMLAALQAERAVAVRVRDEEIAALNARLAALQLAFDLTPSERLKRALRRLGGRPRSPGNGY